MQMIILDNHEEALLSKARIEYLAKKHGVYTEIEIASSLENFVFFMDSMHAIVDCVYVEDRLLSGVEPIKILRKWKDDYDIVFYTKDEDNVEIGYDVDALHYLIKDKVDERKFENVFLKAATRAEERQRETLNLSNSGEQCRIMIDSISYFEVNGRVITVHYGSEEIFRFYSTLSKLQEILSGKGFTRVHQSFLVSNRWIYKKNRDHLILADNTLIPIGRSYQASV